MSDSTRSGAVGNVADEHFIRARGLGLATVRMRAYGGVDLDIARGTAHAVCGEHRSGKTELLLTLAGRMHANEGSLSVGGAAVSGLRDVDALRRRGGLGFFEKVNDVARVLRVRTVTSAELNLAGRPSGHDATRRYLADWHLEGVADRSIESLPRYTYDLLGIALGMCCGPDVLVVHDVERDLTEHQSLKLVDTLLRLAHDRGVTVVCGVTDYALAVRFDGVTCLSDDARAQRDAYLRAHGASAA